MTTGPQDPAAAGRDQLRASHADREQVIGTLKNTFVHGRLTRDELDARTGQALAARTHADLAALTADIPPGPAAAGQARPPPARRRPRARPIVAGICLLIAAAAIAAGILLPDDPGGPSPWDGLIVFLFVSGLFTALGIMACTVYTSWDQRSSRGQLPPRPGPGGHALEGERFGGTGHGPVPPALPPTRPAPTCGLTSHGSTFPPGRAGYRVACKAGPQTRYDAGETSTGTGAYPVVQAGRHGTKARRRPSRGRGANVRKPRGALGLGEGVVGRQPSQQPPGGPGIAGPTAG